ncbi:MAG: hypothetical protein Q9174_000914 [Haloplaca sp. 1 TL-2023]
MTGMASHSQGRIALDHADRLLKTHPSLPIPIDTTRTANETRNGHLNLDTFSPVNQNGSFEFDKVLKNGEVYKRTRKTKQWKKLYMVLRPNLLSVYKSSLEERLHKQITLSDLNAVAQVKDRKGRREHLFALYTPARNFHFQARDEHDAKTWVELIRRESRLDQDEQGSRRSETHEVEADSDFPEQERIVSSSPEPADTFARPATTRHGIKIPGVRRPSTHGLDYSGDDLGTSDWSDAPQQSHSHMPPSSFTHDRIRAGPRAGSTVMSPGPNTTVRNASRSSGFQIQDDERVIWHGYLLILKSKGGVRQWKRVWVVLRPKNLALYKNDEEYAAQLIIPFSNMINAVEIDPLSRSKSHCMQIIAEDKNFRFCAPNEESLARWLGALKSQLARRREAQKDKAL